MECLCLLCRDKHSTPIYKTYYLFWKVVLVSCDQFMFEYIYVDSMNHFTMSIEYNHVTPKIKTIIAEQKRKQCVRVWFSFLLHIVLYFHRSQFNVTNNLQMDLAFLFLTVVYWWSRLWQHIVDPPFRYNVDMLWFIICQHENSLFIDNLSKIVF